MHELGLVRGVVDTVIESAQEAGARQVKRVYVNVGKARDIVPDLMEIAFVHLTRGTLAEGAELVVTSVPVMARCDACGLVFPLDIFDRDSWKCPRCGSGCYEICRGRELDIDRIEVVREVGEQAVVA